MTEQIKEGANENGRDYTRKSYQALMAVVEAVEAAAPNSMKHSEIQAKTGLSRNVVFDVCWNLVSRGWAEEAAPGAIRLLRSKDDKATWLGRMVMRLIRDMEGVAKEG